MDELLLVDYYFLFIIELFEIFKIIYIHILNFQ